MPDGRRIFEYSAEAKAWFIAVVMFSRGIHVPGKRHRIEFCVYRGRGERGDLDNYPKCIFDGLQKAGVIANDDSVVEIHGYKERDPDDPRTEICITEIE
jgi:Holliday junction resolvase RusA-like endonuclease